MKASLQDASLGCTPGDVLAVPKRDALMLTSLFLPGRSGLPSWQAGSAAGVRSFTGAGLAGAAGSFGVLALGTGNGEHWR
jgi:hypothetical protein